MDTRLNRDPDPYRIYMIVRGDQEMSKGKIASQCGHAALETFIEAQTLRPETIPLYKTNHGIKIAMVAKNLGQLILAYETAKMAGIPAALITDLGYFGTSEELLGKPNITALGIGPARRSEVDRILRRFQIMRD